MPSNYISVIDLGIHTGRLMVSELIRMLQCACFSFTGMLFHAEGKVLGLNFGRIRESFDDIQFKYWRREMFLWFLPFSDVFDFLFEIS
jgi:hypothetical protein